MFLRQDAIKTQHLRKSKLGMTHKYYRTKIVLVFRCDNCNEEFHREKRLMDPRRISNNYFHVCSQCDAKRFAQRKGVEQKKIWDMPASTDLPVGKY